MRVPGDTTAGHAELFRALLLTIVLSVALPSRGEDSRDLLFEALRSNAAALARDPSDRTAAAAVARALVELGAFHGAARVEGHASLATRAGQAAELVRWGESIPPDTPALRFAGTDAALAMLEALIAEARAAGDRPVLAQLRGDRVVALRDRERWSDALAELALLRAEDMPIRPYVRQAEADALLALRRPEEARSIDAELAAADPGNHDARVGRFHAEVECEDFAAAFATVDELKDPVLAARARDFAGLEAEAWRRIAPILEHAPAAAYVRSAAGSIEAARGWARRAHEDLLIASALDPDDLGIAVAVAESQLRRRELPAARAAEARLATDFPTQPSVVRLTQELRDFDSPSWQFEARGRQESGGAAAAPGPGVEVSGRVYSQPFQDAFRLFAGAAHATARPPEGDVVRDRAGGGVEWRGADTTLAASAWSNWGTLSRPGAEASAAWSANDVWSFSADYERYAWETPLRAVLHGITSDGGGVGVGAEWNESRAAWLGYRVHDFTDGNRREELRAAWAERVVDQPAWSLTLRPDLYISRNSLAGAPYFNPSRDVAGTLALDFQGLLWRRYEQVFRHRIVVRAGAYRQEGFADGGIGGVAYEQSWQPHARLELRWGIEAGRARYDGANEKMAILFFAASGRF
jgi:biofilm PGA synthesis protein PgaA